MNIFLAIFLVLATTSIAVCAILLVRRIAPDGGYFNDGDRAAGVFGVLATGFGILLGFIVFLAFASYDTSRAGAEEEALLVGQQFETAQFLPSEVRGRLAGELICYGRYVIDQEWPQMETGDLNSQLNPWGIALFETLSTVEPESNSEQSAYDKWLEQTSERESARQDRVHGAEGIIPLSLWLVLFVGAGVIFVFMLFFADSGERWVVQGLLIGSVVAVMTATFILIYTLNRPFQPSTGGLRPVAMERMLNILEGELADVGQRETPPCTESGEPV
jgi:hypothetical protein